LVDTNQNHAPDGTQFEFGAEYIVTGRSLLLFELVLDSAYTEACGIQTYSQPAVASEEGD